MKISESVQLRGWKTTLYLGYYYVINRIKDRYIAEYYVRLLKFFNKNKEYIVKKINGNYMKLVLDDVGISKELLAFGKREVHSTNHIKTIIKPGDTVIDIGANIGYYALLESKLVGETGRVYAIEPVPFNFDLLKYNVELNNINNIKLFDVAIGNENTISTIYLSNKCNHHSMIKDCAAKGLPQETVDVNLMTLDRFVELYNVKRVDLVRMDVEGYETCVIDGAMETLRRFKPYLFIEIHPKHTSRTKDKSIKKMLKVLKGLGYETTQVVACLRVEKLDITQLLNDYRVADETPKEKRRLGKTVFEIFLRCESYAMAYDEMDLIKK